MKYIRTTKNIYKTEDCFFTKRINEDGTEAILYVSIQIDPYTTAYEKVKGQADTIEELCDEFVWTSNNGHKPIIHYGGFRVEQAHKRLSKTMNTELEEIYGAIWTDDGLKYVAKMNEKGELCLI